MKWVNRVTEYLFYLFFASLIFSNTLAQGCAVILIFLWLFRWIATRRFVKTPLDVPVILYLLVRAISCFGSIDMVRSFGELRSGIFFSLIYFAITNFSKTEDDDSVLYRNIAILIYAGAIAALFGIIFFFVLHGTVKAQSTAGGITRFAEYSMIALCLSFALAHERRIFPKRFLAFITIGMLTGGLILAQQRAQWLGIIPVAFIIGFKRERWMLGYIIAVSGGLTLFLRTIRSRLQTFSHLLSYTTGRLDIWHGARTLLFKRPILGFGPRTYPVISPVLKDRGTWHSDYLQTYMDSGILGLVSYLFLSVMLFINCIAVCTDDRQRDIGFALLFVFIAMYIVSFFGGHIQEPVITPLFFSLVAFVSLFSKRIKKECGLSSSVLSHKD